MKKVLISGSSSGIGAALTRDLLSQGISVVGVARDPTKLKLTDAHYFPVHLDFSKMKTLEAELKQVRACHPDIDAIISCCGYGKFLHLEQFSFADMQRLMEVNFLSQALLVKLFLPDLKKKTNAKIIFVGSESGLTGQRLGSMYCASKFALRGFAQSLRQECRHAEVAVTLINPGLVDTPFFKDLDFKPAEEAVHAIQPEQVAHLIKTALFCNNNCVIEEINCQPMVKRIVKTALR